MKLKVNSKEMHTNATTVKGLLEEMGLPPVGVAVAIDNKMLPRLEWDNYRLSENLSVVIIKAACGG